MAEHYSALIKARLVDSNNDGSMTVSHLVNVDWILSEAYIVQGLNHTELLWGQSKRGSLMLTRPRLFWVLVISRAVCL
jgi:hypothetical protein